LGLQTVKIVVLTQHSPDKNAYITRTKSRTRVNFELLCGQVLREFPSGPLSAYTVEKLP